MTFFTKYVLVFLFWSSCIADEETQPVSYEGFCAFPCSFQNRTYERQGTTVSAAGNYSCSDPTFVPITESGTDRKHLCYARTGPFIITRRTKTEGYETVWEYRCEKDVRYDDTSDIIIFYRSQWKTFLTNPTICDVCDGNLESLLVIKDVEKECSVVIVPDVGCNLPIVCPVTNENQIQCPCTEKFDDGFCCDECAVS